MLERIPEEMRALPQWVCGTTSKIKKEDKVPINPMKGTAASPTDSSTWTTFTNAIEKRTAQCPHVGFVLCEADPYTIIDLDDPYNPDKDWTDEKRDELAALNEKIVNAFPSYTEISQSGSGVHIVVKGTIPHGVHRDTVEIYSSQRYMICTGNVMKDLPIIDCQAMLDNLFAEMDLKSSSVELTEVNQTAEDADIVEMAMSAVNGDLFTALCNGDMTGYPSQSEADLALMSILAFYTKSNEQVRRIFRMTLLGKRDKAVRNNKYLDYTLQQIRSHDQAPINTDGLKEKIAAMLAPTPEQQTKSKEIVDDMVSLTPSKAKAKGSYFEPEFPPGLVGEVAEYIYSSAARPVKEIGLIAAIGMISGMVGRQYNVSGVGLNQYLILLAKTGMGKEGISGGIDRLNTEVRKSVPMVDQFRGPGAFASGPALIKTMADRPCFISILGEFGITLQQICEPKAMGALVTLKHALLDLYQKSGWHSTLQASVYSDKEKNTSSVQAPALSILGESTPETFLEGLGEQHIADGLIPRFIIREYLGLRPYLNEKNGFAPSDSLVNKLIDLTTLVLTMQANASHVNVILDANAKVLSDAFERETTDLVNNAINPVLAQLWNRAHLKVLKLAAVIAVGMNYNAPVVNERVLLWAMAYVKQDISTLLSRFETGDIGSGESKQEADLHKKITAYFKGKPSIEYRKFHAKGVIPLTFIRRAVANLVSFKSDQHGSTRALMQTLEAMVTSGILIQVAPVQAKGEFQTSSKLYTLGDMWSNEG
jgi:hypothetical protein